MNRTDAGVPSRLAFALRLVLPAMLVLSTGLAAAQPVLDPALPPHGPEAPSGDVTQAVPPTTQPQSDVKTHVVQAPATKPLPGNDLAPPAMPLPPPPELLPASFAPHDFSPWGMIRSADIVVKMVMGILAIASAVTWTIFIAKRLQLAGARFRAVRDMRKVLRATSLFDLDQKRHKGSLKSGPVAVLVHAAAYERERSANLPADGIKERAAIALGRIEARAARTMTRGTGLVASIGSTAPFVGLFGTVWGIMNSFVGISQAHTTNLAVVAPGIAEALLATAIGLVAAIPAVIIYNGLARAIAGYKAILSDASAEIMRHLSRDLDRQVQAAE